MLEIGISVLSVGDMDVGYAPIQMPLMEIPVVCPVRLRDMILVPVLAKTPTILIIPDHVLQRAVLTDMIISVRGPLFIKILMQTVIWHGGGTIDHDPVPLQAVGTIRMLISSLSGILGCSSSYHSRRRKAISVRFH
jgi:hypothetical protein